MEPRVIVERILWVLNDRDYRIVSQTDNLIKFDNWSSALLRSRTAPRQLEKGVFEISPSINEVRLRLTYPISFVLQIIIIFATIIFAFLTDWGALFLTAFIFVASIADFFNVKLKAKELLLNAVDKNVVQPGSNHQ